jgi:L-lactate dehydrogenase complex protein LldG
MNDARRVILERVTNATGGTHGLEQVPRAYRHSTSLDYDLRVALFCSRVGEYHADVRRIDEANVASTVATVCSGLTLVAPGGIPDSWRPTEVLLVEDDALSPLQLDAIDGTLTGCTVAVAETGTIILTAGHHEGRRALTLVPDLHICVVRESQIVHLLPEALTLISAEGLDTRPITFISGPSATSDIELSRVEGVHGPRTLIVLVVKEVT